jgi:hypothetical protein
LEGRKRREKKKKHKKTEEKKQQQTVKEFSSAFRYLAFPHPFFALGFCKSVMYVE